MINPSFIAIPITSACNYRCKFCEVSGVSDMLKKRNRQYQKNSMSFESIQKFKPMIKTAQVVNLGGRTGPGEPLLAKNFEDIVREIRNINSNVVIDLTTNGSLLTKERSEFLVSMSPVAVTFSIHASTPESYSDIMATSEKAFHRVVENIINFCQAAQGKQVQVSFNFGFGKKNYQDIEDIISFARNLGVHFVTVFPYYKSPNKFMEDVSLYDDIALANETIKKAYDHAAKIGQRLNPPEPNLLKDKEELSKKELEYSGGCQEPFTSFLLKGDMYSPGKAGFCVCNRIILAHVDIDNFTSDDLYWAWYHPIVNMLRLPNPRDLPPICKFCKDPEISSIRSLDHEEYKKRRDRACKETLAMFQSEELRSSPSRAICLLEENIFSVDYQFSEIDSTPAGSTILRR